MPTFFMTPLPISAAPRDGTRLLVFVSGAGDHRRRERWTIAYWYSAARHGTGSWYSDDRRRITGVTAFCPLPPLWDGTERRGMIAHLRRKMGRDRRNIHNERRSDQEERDLEFPAPDRRQGERRNRHGGRRLGIDYTEESPGIERRAFVPEVRVLPPERRTEHPEGRRFRHVISGDPAFVDRRTKWPEGRRVGEDFNDRRKK